jgi:hypothetical protein
VLTPSSASSQPSGWKNVASRNLDVPAESSKPTTPQRVGKEKTIKLEQVDCFLKYLLDLHTKNSSRTANFVQRLAWAFASGDKKNPNSDANVEIGGFNHQKVKFNEITFGLFIDGLPEGKKLYTKTGTVYALTEDGANHLHGIVQSRDAWDMFMKKSFTEYVQGRWGNDKI